MQLTIDTREKSLSLLELLVDRCTEEKVPYVIATLTVGDYVWGDDQGALIGIEHKSVTDFINSANTHHLFSQLEDLKQYPIPILLIDGKWAGAGWRSGFTVRRRNRVLTEIVSMGVPYHQVTSEDQLVDAIFYLRESIDPSREKMRSLVIERHTKRLAEEDPYLYMIQQLPGVGDDRARKIIQECPSFSEFLHTWRELPRSALTKTTRTFLETLLE